MGMPVSGVALPSAMSLSANSAFFFASSKVFEHGIYAFDAGYIAV